MIKVSALALTLLLLSCSPTRRLGDGELLYRGAEVELPEQANEEVESLENALNTHADPDPNSRVLGVPLGLLIYQTFDKDNDGKGIGHWIKTRLGEPPVLYDPKKERRSALRMEALLKDEGFLQGSVKSDTLLHGRKVRIVYQIQAGQRYRLRQYYPPADRLSLFEKLGKNPPIQSGEALRLKELAQERARMAREARQAGFYLVQPFHFFYYLDSLPGKQQADLYLRLSPAQDSAQYERFYIGRTMVYPSYRMDVPTGADTLKIGDLQLLDYDTFIKPAVLQRLIRQDSGDLYLPRQEERTLEHLTNLGVYKFVNLKYQRREAGGRHFLDRQIYLTPELPQYFSAELEISNIPGFLGPELLLNYTHRNLFRGAERLRLSLQGGILGELSKSGRFLRASQIEGEIGLEIPRFISPFPGWQPNSISPPRTLFELNGQYLFDFENFTLNSVQFQAGYRWQPNRFQQHEFSPLHITRQALLSSSETFENRLQQNARLRSSVENLFILGMRYRYLYAEPEQRAGAHRFFFLGTAEESSILTSMLTDERLLGQRLARYLRLEVDGRHYLRLGKTELVTRLNIGAGFALGDDQVLPFSRQFFVGGSNSIRAFRIRRLGPGRSDDFLQAGNAYSEQTGDLKIEANLEYRFPMIPYLKGALFLDAGNIWLLRDPNNETPGGVFAWDTFPDEVALGAGLGLRLDIDLFVIRLDTAFPLRRPWLLPGDPWLDDFRPLKGDWRRENLVWHLALGYPF